MAKEINVTFDFLEKQLVCELTEQTMDVLLKIRTKTGEHTFRENVYTHTLKYCRWNNQLKPFRSLKRRVANIFRKRNSLSHNSRGTSTQSIVNHMEREEERSIIGSDKRNSIHSDWSDLISVDEVAEYGRVYKNRKGPNATSTATTSAASAAKATLNTFCFPSLENSQKHCAGTLYSEAKRMGKLVDKVTICIKYCCKPTCSTQAITSRTEEEDSGKDEGEGELAYEPHSPYYSPVHPPEFYEDE